MGLFWWASKTGIVKHETENTLKENPDMIAWLKTHKMPVGVALVFLSSVLAQCHDPLCVKYAPMALAVGTVLVGAGGLNSDPEAKRKLGQLQIAIDAGAPAIIEASKAALEIAAAVHEALAPAIDKKLQENQDATLKAVNGIAMVATGLAAAGPLAAPTVGSTVTVNVDVPPPAATT